MKHCTVNDFISILVFVWQHSVQFHVAFLRCYSKVALAAIFIVLAVIGHFVDDV